MVAWGLELHGTAGGHLFPDCSHVLLAFFIPASFSNQVHGFVCGGCSFVWPSPVTATDISGLLLHASPGLL